MNSIPLPIVGTHGKVLVINAEDYASQGNGILGIRDSGKSYTATLFAERLLGAGIPFVAFDPIGVWRFLKVPGTGKGFEVVVAGGENGDLPLTPESAPEIVRGAMRNNIPLVLDLYSMEMSKADWRRIVETCIRLLLYENKAHGLRHVFIEEAAEFAPQRIGPESGRVYAEIEKLVRMGGNAMLGYTLINQRAEEVNKAVLELCDCLFLHRQKGKNSLTSLGKWLDFAGSKEQSREIVASLPTLPQGECWVWPAGSETPLRVKIPQKRSLHPNRRQAIDMSAKKLSDVSSFVETITRDLKVKAEEKETMERLRERVRELEHSTEHVTSQDDLDRFANDWQNERHAFEHRISALEAALSTYRDVISNAQSILASAEDSAAIDLQGSAVGSPAAKHMPAQPARTTARSAVSQVAGSSPASPSSNGSLTGAKQKILNEVAHLHRLRVSQPTTQQVAVFCGVSHTTGSFLQNLRDLDHDGYLTRGKGTVALTQLGEQTADLSNVARGSLLQMWLQKLDGARAKMLQAIVQLRSASKDTLATSLGVSPTTGSFLQNLRDLRNYGIVEIDGGVARPSALLMK